MKNIPAFPKPFSEDRFGGDRPEKFYAQDGMTLRDYFAGQALAGLASAHKENGTWTGLVPNLAEQCYKIANQMLNERQKW